MEQRLRLRLCVLGTALATSAAFAGTYAALDQSALMKDTAGATAVTANETLVATLQQTVTTSEEARIVTPAVTPLPPAESAPLIVPQVAASAEPPITITEQRITEDERIQGEVMELLARNDGLTGKVGVESRDRIVMLSGYLLTSGQVWRAGRNAGTVTGVRYVVNEIRPRMGVVMN